MALDKRTGLRSVTPWGLLAVVLALASLAGCAGLLRHEEPPLQEATAEQLTQLLREREEVIQTMKGLFRAQIKGPGIPLAQRVEGALVYRRSSGLRLRGFNHVGGALFDFTLADDLYTLHVPGRPVVTGRVVDLERMETLGRPLRLSLLAIGGAVGIASVAKDERVLLVEEEDRYRLDVWSSVATGLSRGGGPIRRIWFERRSLEVVQEDRLTEAGTLEATVRLEDFRPVDLPTRPAAASGPLAPMANAILKPFKIMTQDGQGQGTLQLTFHEIIPNPEIRPEELGLAGREDRQGLNRMLLSKEPAKDKRAGEGEKPR